MEKGLYTESTEMEKLEEIHELVRCLTNDTIFMNEHASNLFHVKCRIPEAKKEALHGKLWDSPLISHASRASFPPGGSLRNLAFPLRGRWIAKGETDEVFFIPQETVKNQKGRHQMNGVHGHCDGCAAFAPHCSVG